MVKLMVNEPLDYPSNPIHEQVPEAVRKQELLRSVYIILVKHE
jgi:hypothetical protein